MPYEVQPGESWCFCPKCKYLVYDTDKPWKRPWCSECGLSGKVPSWRVCPYRRCGNLKEECTCGDQA